MPLPRHWATALCPAWFSRNVFEHALLSAAATFDSSDASDTDSDGEATNDTVTTTAGASSTAIAPNTSPCSTTPAATSPGAAGFAEPRVNRVDPEMPEANGRIATVEIHDEVDGTARTEGQV